MLWKYHLSWSSISVVRLFSTFDLEVNVKARDERFFRDISQKQYIWKYCIWSNIQKISWYFNDILWCMIMANFGLK